LELRKLQMNNSLSLYLIHVAGKRMIAQGTDGLSRGASYLGVMSGNPFLDYIPLHQNALDRQGPFLLDWAMSWFSGTGTPLILTPNDWFTMGTHSFYLYLDTTPSSWRRCTGADGFVYTQKTTPHTLDSYPAFVYQPVEEIFGKSLQLIFHHPTRI
jgi:hypothetical protein